MSTKLNLFVEDSNANQKITVINPVSAPTGASSPPVDLARLRETMGEEVVEVVDLYLNETARNLETLALAIEAGNAQEVEVIAHSSAGASLSCGINAVVPVLGELEALAREGCLDSASELLDEARTQLATVSSFLDIQLKPQRLRQLRERGIYLTPDGQSLVASKLRLPGADGNPKLSRLSKESSCLLFSRYQWANHGRHDYETVADGLVSSAQQTSWRTDQLIDTGSTAGNH